MCVPLQSGQHALALTDIFLERPEPVQALLPLLSSRRTFYTRFASLQLLGTLLRNRAARVQEHILVAPGGCGAILECVAEDTTGPGGLPAGGGARSGSSAEIIRNEALLVLPHLVHGNPDVQKLVAFEGAFDKLLDVVAQEGRIEGGVVVQDALEGLEALLRYNVSNQNYFRETMSVPMLAPLLFFPPPPPSIQQGAPSRQAEQEYARQLEGFAFQVWDDQKVLNARLVIGIAGLLVSGQGAQKRSNQVSKVLSNQPAPFADTLALPSERTFAKRHDPLPRGIGTC
jgi:intracellular protein transport protein USO1